jgi:3'-phosphoadenosine 5'-phosphosulfate sulfotransferase (PAPS reductase)/FAD synthetase
VWLKKNPINKYNKKSGRKAIIGTMAGESNMRQLAYLQRGCNSFEGKHPISTPIAFWREQDIWKYINKNKIAYSTIYNMGEERTGCMFCMFGVQTEKGKNRFQRMKKSHPSQYKYCMDVLHIREVLEYMGLPSE